MKKFTLLVAATLLLSLSAKATVSFKTFEKPHFSVNNFNDEPISFMERGIAFYIFPDGQFDFNTEPSRGEILYKHGRRNYNYNTTSGASEINFGGRIKIEHDQSGRIRRIGNVFINYDFNDRIKRIGSVFMSYNRFALVQVGGLRIIYNRYGQAIDFVGNVKGRWTNFNDNCDVLIDADNNGYNYNSNNNSSNNDPRNNDHQNNDPYYYKKNNNKESSENKIPENDSKNQSGRR